MVKRTAAQDVRDLVQRVRKHAEEERELVRALFRDMVTAEPLWIVPSLLSFAANEAAVADMQTSRCIAGTIPIDDLRY